MAELDEGEGEGSGLLATLEARDPDKLPPEPQEPVAEAAPPAPAPEPEPEAKRPDPGYVPLPELQKERARRRELEEKLARLEGRFDEIAKRAEPAKPAEPVDELKPPPEELYNQNAAEYLRQVAEYNAKVHQREIDTIQGKIRDYEAQETQAAQRRQQAEQVQQLDMAYATSSRAYFQENPEAWDAYQAFANGRLAQLKAIGYPEDRAQAVLANEERTIAYQALTTERNPAQVIHAMMAASGWQPAKAVDPTPHPPVGPTPSRDERRRAAATSLSQASGGAVSAPSMGDIANMSADEYAAWKKKGGRVEDMVAKRVA